MAIPPNLNETYYREVWGFDPAEVIHPCPKKTTCLYILEDGFPLEAEGDEILNELEILIYARVIVRKKKAPRNRIVLKWKKFEGLVKCVHLAVYAATPEELEARTLKDEEIWAESTEGRPVDLEPLEHFAALRSYVAGLAEVGLRNIAYTYGDENYGAGDILVSQLEGVQMSIFEKIVRDSESTGAVLSLLSTHDDPKIRRKIGENPKTPLEVLVNLASDDDETVLRGLIKNRYTPGEAFEVLASRAPHEVLALALDHPNVTFSVIEAVWKKGTLKEATDALHHPEAPIQWQETDFAKFIASHQQFYENKERRLLWARARDAPHALLACLARDPLPEVRYTVVKNPSTPVEVLEELAGDNVAEICAAVAWNVRTSPEVLEALSEIPNIKILIAVAWNPWTPPRAFRNLLLYIQESDLKILSNQGNFDSHTPPPIDDLIRAILKNHNTPKDLVSELWVIGDLLTAYRVLVRPDISPELRESTTGRFLEDHGAEVGSWKLRLKWARSDATPREIKDRLERDLHPVVRKEALTHHILR